MHPTSFSRRLPISTICFVLAFGVALAAVALPCQAEDTRPSPEAFYKTAVRNADPKQTGGAGEQFCWRANYNMGLFVAAYEAWHDTAWLDWGVKYYDYAISQMSTDPKGYKGWIGPYIYDNTYWCDVHVGDSILVDHMLEFAEVVRADPALSKNKTYRQAADRYVALARKDVIEKWDSRGTWREDGPFGGYVSWDTYCNPNDLANWKKMPEARNSGLSLPFNKQNDMALVCIKLYRLTGEESYRDKATKIFTFMRSRFQFVDDYYCWNYWEPLGPWDVDLVTGRTRHWMNTHGYRDYQAGEVGQAAAAYHAGIVFTQTDIQRVINTNLEVMWNKDRKKPKFINSNATLPKPEMSEAERKAREKQVASNAYAKEGRAGCLWTGLLDFSQAVRDLREVGMADGGRNARSVIARAYYRNVTAKRPASFKRKHAKGDVSLSQWPVSKCRSLTVAAVLPHVIRRGGDKEKKAIILSKARLPVDLEVSVCSADGKNKLLVLHKGKVDGGLDGLAGIFILQWDGADPAGKVKLPAGQYCIRWTTPDGHREFPVRLVD